MTRPASNNLLIQIEQSLESLNKSERKVAEAILSSPEGAARSTISSLAKQAGVSEPTVNRFCRRYNSDGFAHFKIQLAQSYGQSGTPYINQSVEPDDNAQEYSDKILQSTMASLDRAREELDVDAISQAVDYLIQAKQIVFFGSGGSAAVAHDAQHKFFRFNIPVSAYDDYLTQRMVAASAAIGDVYVVISYTGRTRELVEATAIASDNGATIIGISAADSPLSRVCNTEICVSSPEDTDIYMPMASRIIHLCIIDILATGVTLKRGPHFQDHLKKIKASLKAARYPEPPDDEAAQ